jgi:hypothetical protein
MSNGYEKMVYEMFLNELVTPNEVVKRLGINYRTVEDCLMQLTMSRKDVRYKGSGRIHIFWRGCSG